MKWVIILIVILVILILWRRNKTGESQPDVIPQFKQPDVMQRKKHDIPDFSDWTLKDRIWKRKHRYPYGPVYPYYDYYDDYPYWYYYGRNYNLPYQQQSTWTQNGYQCFEDGKNGVPVKLEYDQIKIALDFPREKCYNYINKPMGITTVRTCTKSDKSEECKKFVKLLN